MIAKSDFYQANHTSLYLLLFQSDLNGRARRTQEGGRIRADTSMNERPVTLYTSLLTSVQFASQKMGEQFFAS